MRELAHTEDCTILHTSPVCAFPPPKGLGLDQTTKGTKRGAAEEEDRKQSHPKLPPPFSLLCNLLIRCGWEPDTLHLRKGPGLPSRAACGERPPLPFLLPSRGAQVFLLRPLGGEGRLAATSLAPLCHSALPRCVWSPVLGSSVSGVPCPPPVSRVPGAFPPPCYGGVCAQGSGTRHCVPSSPSAPGFAWENPSVNYATG